ncbi:formate dehydrogenase accessory sulfurtransferase FdhD [Methylophaga sp. OBS3]|uniref:formate dehydrogenase accessory sulfurtransferase FdhD n=1 Tax=Methylophaga sp. OBS3 TaxID=2991934 RepID=UPI00224FCCEF|nr:formate dehydrogenase accessory sulfurtransferase FdhD [Methylophaga sp. OBS3]MCX4189176.1 formate dehydrogenase accessory sulfurtransferase FdhD [Methylophaga sp. OBS3]
MADSKLLRPTLSQAGIHQLHQTTVLDESGESREVSVTGERPLTIYLDKREIVTLMTLGAAPEWLTLGYLRNQGLVDNIEDIESVQVDWDVEAVAVTTRRAKDNLDDLMSKRTVTSGCGQGTMFGHVMTSLSKLKLDCPSFTADRIYQVLENLREHNEVYKQAGAVHGCALCSDQQIDIFIEDVGRHNAVDAISGWMWLNNVKGADKVFYTTGRLTSEMVIKVAQMQVPLLLSRSGVTEMGLQIAEQIGIGMVARAKGRHFLVYTGKAKFKPE